MACAGTAAARTAAAVLPGVLAWRSGRSTLLADPELRRGFAARSGCIEAELAWLPATDPASTVGADVNTLVTAPRLSPSIMVSGYVYNTAAGTLDAVVAPTPAGQR